MIATLPLGITIYCAVGILSCFISLVVNTWYNGKLVNFGFWSQMKDLFPIYLLSVVTFCVSLGITYIIPNEWLQIIIGGIVGILVYLGIAYLTKMHELEDVKYMLKRKG